MFPTEYGKKWFRNPIKTKLSAYLALTNSLAPKKSTIRIPSQSFTLRETRQSSSFKRYRRRALKRIFPRALWPGTHYKFHRRWEEECAAHRNPPSANPSNCCKDARFDFLFSSEKWMPWQILRFSNLLLLNLRCSSRNGCARVAQFNLTSAVQQSEEQPRVAKTPNRAGSKSFLALGMLLHPSVLTHTTDDCRALRSTMYCLRCARFAPHS